MLSGDNGILQRATDAKTRTERQSIIEQARTDILGYQVENKGGDLEKSQLKSVLDKYFNNVPTVEELPDGEELLNLPLTTLEDYGTHTIKVSEIYDGNIAGSSKIKAATLFEDKAGDEDGATEGKIHIGDYVNYNPIAQGDTGTEAKYKYESLNSNTGITEAIAASEVTFTDDSQDFTVKSNLKWQIVGIDGDNILITTELPITPDNAITYNGNTGYGLYGAKGYINVSPNSGERNEINNISQIYKYGKGADSSKTRGMTIEDVNKITGVTADGTTLSPSGIYTAPTGYEYGTTLTDYKKGDNSGWTPEAWLDTNINKSNSANAPGYSGEITGYYYQGSNINLKTANSAIRNNIVFGESSSQKAYWLASRGVYVNSTCATFAPGIVYYGTASSYYNVFTSNGYAYFGAFGVHPVIYLDSNVSLTSAGTTNNVTTWNID